MIKNSANNIYIPITPDDVLDPKVIYNKPISSINFITEDDKYGRITFENMDSMKISRGEYFPYKIEDDNEYSWITIVKNSIWLEERYNYEKKYYGNSYNFNGNVEEMKTDFKHYVFSFHDQFIEVLASGFWFEKSDADLADKDLSDNHPFLPINQNNVIKFDAFGITCQARITNKSNEKLLEDSFYCTQKLIDFIFEFEDFEKFNNPINYRLKLIYKNKKYYSILEDFFGKIEHKFEGIIDFEKIKPYIESYMKEIYEYRKNRISKKIIGGNL